MTFQSADIMAKSRRLQSKTNLVMIPEASDEFQRSSQQTDENKDGSSFLKADGTPAASLELKKDMSREDHYSAQMEHFKNLDAEGNSDEDEEGKKDVEVEAGDQSSKNQAQPQLIE